MPTTILRCLRGVPSTASKLILLAVLAGCGEDGPPGPPDPNEPCAQVSGTPEVEIGGAAEEGVAYEPLAEGSPAPLRFGQQQGFHVWTHIRARGVCYKSLQINRTAKQAETGAIVLSGGEKLDFIPAVESAAAAAGWIQLPASLPTFLCPPVSVSVLGKAIELHVKVTDKMGRTAETVKTVYPFCPEGPAKTTCESTCY